MGGGSQRGRESQRKAGGAWESALAAEAGRKEELLLLLTSSSSSLWPWRRGDSRLSLSLVSLVSGQLSHTLLVDPVLFFCLARVCNSSFAFYGGDAQKQASKQVVVCRFGCPPRCEDFGCAVDRRLLSNRTVVDSWECRGRG